MVIPFDQPYRKGQSPVPDKRWGTAGVAATEVGRMPVQNGIANSSWADHGLLDHQNARHQIR